MNKSVRLNLQLNADVLTQLKLTAKSQSVSINTLILSWLKSGHTFTIKNISYKMQQKARLNLRMDNGSYNKALNLSSLYKLKLTSFLQLLISNSLTKRYRPAEAFSEIGALSQKGRFYDIISILSSKLDENLSAFNLKALGQAYIECGFPRKLKAVIVVLEKHYPQEIDTINYFKIEAEYEKHIKTKEMIADTKMLLANTSNPIIKNHLLYSLADSYNITSDFENAINYFQQIIENTNLASDPGKIADCYVRIANIYISELNLIDAQRYLNRAESILNNTQNYHSLSIFHRVKHKFLITKDPSLKNLYKDEFDKFLQFQYLSIGSSPHTHASLRRLARLHLENLDYDKAHLYLQKARKIENNLRPNFEYSLSDFYIHTIEAKDNYTKGITGVQKLKAIGDNLQIEPVFGEYMLSTNQYLFADDENDFEAGKLGLKTLLQKPNYSLINRAAEYTLENKRIYLNL